LITAVAYVGMLAVVAAIAFFVVLFLAGPHAGLLPQWAEAAVLVAGWLAVLVLPVLTARKVWLRLHRRDADRASKKPIQPDSATPGARR
jgi:hypothetical protein